MKELEIITLLNVFSEITKNKKKTDSEKVQEIKDKIDFYWKKYERETVLISRQHKKIFNE